MATLNAQYIANLFDRVGAYRQTPFNQAAIQSIQKGASLGLGVVDKLPGFISATEKNAATEYARTGSTDAYQALKIIADTLVSTSVKTLYAAIKREEAKDVERVNSPRYHLTGIPEGVTPAITPDAWATEDTTTEQAATAEELSQKASVDDDHVGREMMDEEEWENRPLSSAEIREQTELLAEMFSRPCLLADQLLNSWRADYADRPHISYLRVPLANNSFKDCGSIDEAINTLRLMEDERAIQRRDSNRRTVAAAAHAWANA